MALLLALWLDRITTAALPVTLVALLLAWRLPSLSGHRRTLAWSALLAWAVALTLHLVPGFSNLKVLDQALAGPASVPFNMYLNLDKPLLFFGLLLACPTLLGKGGAIRWRPLALLLLPLGALQVIAWQLGALRPEVGLPHWWWLFALNNLLFTCVAEEALFRGAIQQGLAERYRPWMAIVVAAMLFGGHPPARRPTAGAVCNPGWLLLWPGIPAQRAALGGNPDPLRLQLRPSGALYLPAGTHLTLSRVASCL